MVRVEARGEESSNVPLLHKVRGLVLDPCLRARECDGCEPETVLIEIARLLGVSNVDFHVVDPFDRKNISFHVFSMNSLVRATAINSFPQNVSRKWSDVAYELRTDY